MNGRQEHKLNIERRIQNQLQDNPMYLKDYARTFADKTINTKASYLNYVIEFLEYVSNELHLDVNDPNVFKMIKTSHLNGYLEYIQYSKNKEKKENGKSICATKIYAIKNFFKFLYIDKYINEDPSIQVSIPKVRSDIKIVALDEKEVSILKRNIINGIGSSKAQKRQLPWKNRDLAIVMIGLVTGLRVNAITEINISDIDFTSNSINVIEKGDVERTCYIGENTMNILLDWLNDRNDILNGEQCDALFISSVTKNGKHLRITTSGVRKLLNKYTANIDKHITPHKLRSTCATTTYRHTGDIYLTASVIGHKNIQNTRRYAMVAESEKQTAASKLDIIFS